MFEYKCPKCGWAGERIVPADERDSQICGRHVEAGHKALQPESERALGLQSVVDDQHSGTCDGQLTRDEIALTASMRYDWSNWK